VFSVEFDTGYFDVRAGLRKPDGGVGAEGADFEDVFGVHELAEDGEVLALGGADGDGGEALGGGVGDGGVEAWVRFGEVDLRFGGDGEG